LQVPVALVFTLRWTPAGASTVSGTVSKPARVSESGPTLAVPSENSVTGHLWRVVSLQPENIMQSKHRLSRRAGGVFYWQENGTTKQRSLRTKNRKEAERLLLAMNEAHQQPLLNLALGRAYLAAHAPRLCTRTWQGCDGRNSAPRGHDDPAKVRSIDAQSGV
jgi:hypothetical protein